MDAATQVGILIWPIFIYIIVYRNGDIPIIYSHCLNSSTLSAIYFYVILISISTCMFGHQIISDKNRGGQLKGVLGDSSTSSEYLSSGGMFTKFDKMRSDHLCKTFYLDTLGLS